MVKTTSFYTTELVLLTNLILCFTILLAFWNVDESQYFHHYSLNNFSVCARVCVCVWFFFLLAFSWYEKKIPYKQSAESFAFVLVW